MNTTTTLGCSDGACLFRHNIGQVTNGGCHCVRRQATHTGDGWTIPVHTVQKMVAKAAHVAVQRERARRAAATRPSDHSQKHPAPRPSVGDAERCTTHHAACDCREYRTRRLVQQMLAIVPPGNYRGALRIEAAKLGYPSEDDA